MFPCEWLYSYADDCRVSWDFFISQEGSHLSGSILKLPMDHCPSLVLTFLDFSGGFFFVCVSGFLFACLFCLFLSVSLNPF